MSTPVFRFAPSPNGELHLGHARSAFVGYDWARRVGGRFLLRLEDIDVTRTRPEYVEGIFRDLAWLGLTWEQPVLRQSQHFAIYKAAAAELTALGLTYPCFATRTEIDTVSARLRLPRDPDGAPLYPGLWRTQRDGRGLTQPEGGTHSKAEADARVASGEPHALRLDMRRALEVMRDRLRGEPLTFLELNSDGRRRQIEAHPERWGDVILLRKEIPASYHLSVVVDDARQGITHVTRGRDLFEATGVHRLLQVLLRLPEPIYHHHALLLDATGNKLSKSTGAPSLRSRREAGLSPADVRAMIDCGRQAT